LEFQAEANLPESFVNRQSFQRFIKFCNAEAAKALPTRQLLGGPILNKYTDKVDSGDHAVLKATAPLGSGKRVNFLSDAWENIAKTHILGVILSFASLCVTFGTFTCGSRHDGLAIAEHLESILLLMIAQGWDVGAIVTNNAGNCAELDASWHCAGPRSYSFSAMRTKSICWLRTSSPPVDKLWSFRRTPLSRH
jgi:hypothetical protein